MVKNLFKLVSAIAIAAFLFGCAPKVCEVVDEFEPYPLSAKQYIAKKNNFLIILDSSNSMAEDYNGQSKFSLAKDIVYRMNQTIPDEKLTGGLRTFGMHFLESRLNTQLVYGMTPFSQEDMGAAIETVCRPGGASPLSDAIEAGIDDLRPLAGITAVIIISDGKEIDDKAVVQAREMKRHFKDQVCFYTIQVGDDQRGANLLQQIASVGECGTFLSADELVWGKQMAEFVEKVFFTVWQPRDILFDSGRANIRNDMVPTLNRIVRVLRNNKYLQLIIQGYTDIAGTSDDNIDLSKNRANSVRDYIVQNGVNANRLFIEYYGELYPVASNSSSSGMALNRRVSFRTQ